jgi:hypothetical protein
MMSFLRPVAFTACRNSLSSHALIVERSNDSTPPRTSCSGFIVGSLRPLFTFRRQRVRARAASFSSGRFRTPLRASQRPG